MLKKFLFLLSPHEKRRGLLVLAMMVVMAVLEVAGVASVMPFLSVLGDPGVVHSNPVLAYLFQTLDFSSVNAFLIALGAGAFALILFSALYRAVTLYAINRYVEMRRHSIGKRLLETYLRQPYAFFLDRHSSDLAKGILSEVDQLVSQVLRPGIQMVAYGLVLVAMVVLLVVINPLAAGTVAVVIGTLYTVIYLAVRGVLARIGEDRLRANRGRFTAAGEALGGIKDIKLLGQEQAYLARFHGPSLRQARHMATTQTLSQVPKFLIEAVAFGGILVMALVLTATQGGVGQGSVGEVLPMLGLYAFAGYRMLPAAQKIYNGLARVRFGGAAVASVYRDLAERSALTELPKTPRPPLKPERTISLKNLSYTYPNAPGPTLKAINLTIPVGSSVGIVGGTGAGKTTLVDVLLGLLRPEKGVIAVDGSPVTEDRLPNWQQGLGYVPQEIFLTDSTIAENIALGVPPEEIDHRQVERCARMAHLHDFIVQELPEGYDTVAGERGVRFSGGQRQRIGIARALYREPSILVFDEATSALDTATEQAVMEAIEALHHQKTVILIAHRLETVHGCDQVVLLEHGQVVAQGTYDELERSSERFQAIVAGRGSA